MKLILLLLGMLVGCLSMLAFQRARHKKEYEGTLRVIFDDEADPYLFLELSIDPATLAAKQEVTLRIKTENYASQK